MRHGQIETQCIFRFPESLKILGISVVFGVLSTMGSSTVLGFAIEGILFNISVLLVVLPAVLYIVGPQRDENGEERSFGVLVGKDWKR